MIKEDAIAIAVEFINNNPTGEEIGDVSNVVYIPQSMRRDENKACGDLWAVNFSGKSPDTETVSPEGAIVEVEDATGEARHFNGML